MIRTNSSTPSGRSASDLAQEFSNDLEQDQRLPSVVGRLRRASLALRAEMLAGIHEAGFDLTFAQVAIYRGPGPDGRRPSEVAASSGMSKQSVNDALRYGEEHGYLRLKPDPTDGRGRIVRLTAKGRRLDAAIWQSGRDVERAWAERIGEPAWSTFREVLDTIAGLSIN